MPVVERVIPMFKVFADEVLHVMDEPWTRELLSKLQHPQAVVYVYLAKQVLNAQFLGDGE